MDLIPGIWASPSDKKVAAEVVDRLSSGLSKIIASYEESCEKFITGQLGGRWWWFDSKVFGRRFLATDVFEQLRNYHGFDAMAVPWKQIAQNGSPEIWTPPSIQVSKGALSHSDVFEHEAIHVAQLLVEYEFPCKPKVPFPGPFPSLSARILKEFEAYLVQTVYFHRAYEHRLFLDFNCVETAQLAALRAAFSFIIRQCVSNPAMQGRPLSLSNFTNHPVAQLASNLSKFGDSLSETFEGTVLDSARAIPTLDELAFHLYVHVRDQTENLSANDPRRDSILRTLGPTFFKWSDYESTNPFEILHRFRPPKSPPKLNSKVIDE